MSFAAPIALKLDDEKAERVRRDITAKVVELQQQPFVGGTVLAGIQLASGVSTQVAHRRGSKPVWIGVSVIRGSTTAGVITETARDDKYVTLVANGYGATVTVDLAVLS